MAGARESTTIEVDDAALRAALKRLIARVRRPTGALLEAGEVLTASTKRRFDTQTDPEGQRWAENSDVTLLAYLQRRGGLSARRTATGGRTLTKKGQVALSGKRVLTDHGFLGDIHYQLTADGLGVEVGSDRKYAAMQQFGGRQAEFPWLWGDIPARPFLGLSDEDRAAVLEIFMDDLMDSLAD